MLKASVRAGRGERTQQVSRDRLSRGTGSVRFSILLPPGVYSPSPFTPRNERAEVRPSVYASACGEPERADRRNMMSETVVTMDGSSNNASNNPRQAPTVKTEPGQPNPLAGIRLNVPYFKTIPGIIKLVQLVSGSLLAIYFFFLLLLLSLLRSVCNARLRESPDAVALGTATNWRASSFDTLILRYDSEFELSDKAAAEEYRWPRSPYSFSTRITTG